MPCTPTILVATTSPPAHVPTFSGRRAALSSVLPLVCAGRPVRLLFSTCVVRGCLPLCCFAPNLTAAYRPLASSPSRLTEALPCAAAAQALPPTSKQRSTRDDAVPVPAHAPRTSDGQEPGPELARPRSPPRQWPPGQTAGRTPPARRVDSTTTGLGRSFARSRGGRSELRRCSWSPPHCFGAGAIPGAAPHSFTSAQWRR